MALPQPFVEKDAYTEDEYFAYEQSAFGRWEYVGGQIRAMSGGTDDHNTIAVNIGGTLRNALALRGCRVYVADMKIHTGDGVNAFPDVAVVFGPRQYHRDNARALRHLRLDRTRRWKRHSRIAGLTDVVKL